MRHKKTLIIIASVYFVYCILVAFIAPIFLKPMINEQSKNFIHGELSVESLFINPFNNAISLKGINLTNNKQQTLTKLKSVYINIDLLPMVLLNAHVDIFEIDGLTLLQSNTVWLNLAKLTVNDIDAGITTQEVVIQEIILDALVLNPVLTNAGSTNVEHFLEEIDALLIKSPEEETKPAEEAAPWLVEIVDIKSSNGIINFLDQSIINEQNPNGINTTISPINFHVTSIKSDLSQDIKINLNLGLFKGDISLKGFANAGSQKSNFNYTVEGLQLSSLNSYVEDASFASIISGELNTSGTIKSQLVEIPNTDTDTDSALKSETNNTSELKKEKDNKKQDPLDVVVTNNLQISNIAIKHQNFEGEFIRCAELNSEDLNFSLNVSTLNLNKFSILNCAVKVILDENLKGNFEFAKPSNTQTKNPDTKQETAEREIKQDKTQEKTLNINIALVELSNSEVSIEDYTQGEKVNVRLADLQANVENISAGKSNLTQYSLKTTINEHAPFTIQGNGNFLNPKISATAMIDLNELGLRPFSPYTLNLSSRPIEKGVISIDVDVELIENHFKSENHISIKGFDLGKKQDHESTSKLPIALAVGVLKNKDGVIEIDIPLSGDIDDPSFSVTKQVLKILTNLITNVATAPLSMIGGMLSGSENTDEQFIFFENESTQLNEKALKHISKIADALKSHPEFFITLSAALSQFEQKTMTDDSAKNKLINSRQQKVSQILIDSEVSAQQIVSVPADVSTTKEKASLEVQFFAR
jgi:hypothetical protein